MGIITTLKAGWTTVKMVRGMKSLRAADNEQQRQRAREYLAEILGKQRGIATKIGQWLAESGNNDDPMHALCDNIEPIDSITIIEAIEASFNKDIDQCFNTFSDHGHAASLSQVHRAQLHNGSDVAVKVQYPFIKEYLAGEMSLLGLMPSLGPVKKWGVDINGYRQCIADNLAHELDYLGEIERQESYRIALDTDEQILVPRIHHDHCSDIIICQQWLDGDTLEQASTWPAAERNQLASILLRHFLKQACLRGRIHADPHDGNYRFRNDNNQPSVVLYDFGSLCDVESNCSLALLHLIQGLDAHNSVDPMACLVMAGFDAEKLQHIRQQIPAVCKELFKPFLHHDRFPIQEWHAGAGIRTILGEHTWWFRSAGPANFLMLIRAFAGLLRQLQTLRAFIDWHSILTEVCADIWKPAQQLTIPIISGPSYPCSCIAQHLHIEVLRNGEQTVSLCLPALSVNSLESMVEPEIAQRIQEHGLSISSIIEKCRSGGYQKQILLQDSFEGKDIKLWLS